MKYVIKFLSHSLLIVAFAYMFYFQEQLENYNFWEWCWTVFVSIIGLLNFYILIIGVQISQDQDTDSDEKLVLRLAGFIEFIIILSIWLMGINNHFLDYSFLVCCSGIFIFACGINKFSFSLISFTSLIWLFVLYNSLTVWHSWLLFFLIILSCITSTIIILINDDVDSETPPCIEIIGLIVGISTFLYTDAFGGMYQDTTNRIIWLCCLISCYFAYIRDNIVMFMTATWFTIVYCLLFLFPTYNVLSWLLIGIVSTFISAGILLYYNYRKRMTNLVNYMFRENKRISKQYNSLVIDYKKLVENYNLKNKSNGSILNNIGVGAERTFGSWLVNSLFEIFIG